ncbi:MAG: HEPN domain-containing protein [Candidatus Nanohaloarchaea archaeon]
MKEETREWLERADGDLESAGRTLDIGEERVAMFLCHQAAEKALKAVMIEEDGEYPYTHDLVRLAPAETDDDIKHVLGQLNTVYTGVRYPDEDDTAVDDPAAVYNTTEELLQWIRKRLNA